MLTDMAQPSTWRNPSIWRHHSDAQPLAPDANADGQLTIRRVLTVLLWAMSSKTCVYRLAGTTIQFCRCTSPRECTSGRDPEYGCVVSELRNMVGSKSCWDFKTKAWRSSPTTMPVRQRTRMRQRSGCAGLTTTVVADGMKYGTYFQPFARNTLGIDAPTMRVLGGFSAQTIEMRALIERRSTIK